MKCVVIESPGNVRLDTRELPKLKKDFARIRVKAAAICATDLEVLDGNIPANYPLIPGHEWAGIVSEVENPAHAHWIGKRVTDSNDVVCGVCEACRSGNWRYCKEFEEIGFKQPGAYAEFIDVPVYGLVKLPDSLPYTHAALAEPMGVALGVWEKAEPKFGKTCMIFGAGNNWNQHKKAIALMDSQKIPMELFVSQTLSLDDFQKGFDLARKRPAGFVKAIFVNE